MAKFACGRLIHVITASEHSMPRMTGVAAPRFHHTAKINPPSSAPLVRPRREKAVSTTKGRCRLAEATAMSTAPHATVEILLKRRKKSSDLPGSHFLAKSIVETEASEVRAELTEDMAAARIATMSRPFKTCGTPVNMKMGKM